MGGGFLRPRWTGQGVVVLAQGSLEGYDIPGAVQRLKDHLDVVTNWYVRSSRDRFWAERTGAFDTLHTVLEVTTRAAAPLAPLVTEEVWRGLTGGRSVHLADWPDPEAGASTDPTAAALVRDDALVAAMDTVREVVSTAHALRKANKLRVRQPLRSLLVAVPDPEALQPFADLVAEEINVKEVRLVDEAQTSAAEHGLVTTLQVNARAAGPRLGRDVQRVIQAARAGSWQQADDGTVTVDGIELQEGEYALVTKVEDRLGDTVAAAVLPGGGFVVLDLELDDELLGDGYARDVVRQVQDARKAAGLHVADRITLRLAVPAPWAQAVADRAAFIGEETLAVDVAVEASPVATDGDGDGVDDRAVAVQLAKVER